MLQTLYHFPVPTDDTPARLVSAAERLFAEEGEAATSLRAVARAALASPAAVHYHFGGRDELLRAVLARHLGPLNGQRQALLDAAREQHGEPVPVDAVLRAAFRPDLALLAKLRKHRVEVARFLGRAQTLSGPAVVRYVADEFDTFARLFVPALRRCLPDVGEAELRLRLNLAAATVAAQFATAPGRRSTGPFGRDSVDEQLDLLVAFCGAGMAAPATAKRKKR
jgi:AcrR family transcriptional regulator